MAAAVTHAPAPAGWLALQYAIVLSWLLLGADRTVAEQPIRTIVRGWLPSAANRPRLRKPLRQQCTPRQLQSSHRPTVPTE